MNQKQHVLLPLKQVQIPLDIGWKRKLVEESGKMTSVIQYVSPLDNQIFTTRQQIKEYLEKNTEMAALSPDWFVFSPAAILEKELEFESHTGDKTVISRVPSTDLDVLCSRSCPGRGGIRPALSCSMCLTYFHHKCVHVPEDTEEYICQGCTQTMSLQQKSKRRLTDSPICISLPDKPVTAILSYLEDTRDLLSAGMVCKQWNRASRDPILWKQASFTNMTLSSKWTSFRSQFDLLTKLDSRGMGFSTHIHKVWEALAPMLGSIPTLKFIILGVVTSPVPAVLLNGIKGVKHFEAQYIVHESSRRYNDNKQVSEVELSACSSQPHLRHLSLCSSTLLKLPLQSDLKLLRKLQRLQTLSITSFVPGSLTQASLGFISHLRNLSALQLGSCSDWEDEHFNLLSNLHNLKHLRLENGPVEPSVGLSTALVKLHQLTQLELIVFPLHTTLQDAVTQLPRLNLLNLAPSASNNELLAGMNQTVVSVMKSGHIWCGEWGIVISSNKTCHSTSLVVPVFRAFVADSVLYKAASRRGQGDVLMINVAEAKQLLSEFIPENGLSAVYTVSKNTAHWTKMCNC